MAFCPHCGAPMEDGARYCMSCNRKNTQLDSQGSSALRLFMLENNALITVVLAGMCVSLVFAFLANLAVGGVLAALTGSVISGLLIWAVFSIRSQCNKVGNIPTAGFTVIKVISIIQLVIMALAGVLMLLCGLLLIAAKDMADQVLETAFQGDPSTREAMQELADMLNLNSNGELLGFLAVFMLAFGVICGVYVFLYCVPLLRHANAMRDLVALGIPVKPAVLLPVMLWVGAGFSLLSLAMAPGSIFNLLSILAGVATNACGALLITKASKDLS